MNTEIADRGLRIADTVRNPHCAIRSVVVSGLKARWELGARKPY
jgi:hypothetical protein